MAVMRLSPLLGAQLRASQEVTQILKTHDPGKITAKLGPPCLQVRMSLGGCWGVGGYQSFCAHWQR